MSIHVEHKVITLKVANNFFKSLGGTRSFLRKLLRKATLRERFKGTIVLSREQIYRVVQDLASLNGNAFSENYVNTIVNYLFGKEVPLESSKDYLHFSGIPGVGYETSDYRICLGELFVSKKQEATQSKHSLLSKF